MSLKDINAGMLLTGMQRTFRDTNVETSATLRTTMELHTVCNAQNCSPVIEYRFGATSKKVGIKQL